LASDVGALAFAPATRLAALIRAGEVSSRALVERYLERIAAHDEVLNAVVTVDADGALRRAGECDAAVRRGDDVGPLHGVPMTVKDAFETAGIRTTSGSREYADHVPDGNALAVQRLLDAGVVLLGKTNLPEFVTGQETANAVFGRTNNPWDVERTTGGSSGGAAAALAAGLTALELGSDSGGSIRQPASYCGVYGHFPTQGIVPVRGHLPQVPRDAVDVHVDLMAVGPLARAAEDLAVALDVLAGPDAYGAPAWRLDLPAPRPDPLRVAAWFDDDDFPVDDEVRAVLEEAADGLGVPVDRRARPAFELVEAERVAFDLWVASSSQRTGDEQFARLLAEADALPDDDDRRGARRARAETMRHRGWLRLDAHRRRLQRAWEDFFTDVDVLLCPVSPVVAFPHDPQPAQVDSVEHRLEQTITVNGRTRPYLDQLVWNIVVGMARLPATVAPVGLSRSGLPVGVQIVGRTFADRTTIEVARRVGRFTPPPAYA
jgi:amidase